VNVIDAFVWAIPWNQCCIGNKREPCIKTIKSITKIIELQVQTSRRLIFFFHILLRILDSDFTPFTIGKHFAFFGTVDCKVGVEGVWLLASEFNGNPFSKTGKASSFPPIRIEGV